MAKFDTPPVALFENAQSYLLSIRILNRQPAEYHDNYTAAFYLLAAFAVELFLKAVIRHRTNKEADIENLRHDLRKALKKAYEVGLTDDKNPLLELPTLVSMLSDNHKNLTFRYTQDVDSILVPHPDMVIRVLDELEVAVAWIMRKTA